MSKFYDFSALDRKGREVSMNEYAGEVVLVVNSATKCGFTPQYRELEQMYEDYKGKGFTILDFPCNQFAGQAPGSDEEIHAFCTLNYGVEFPSFKKIEVNGAGAHPLFKFLKSQKGFEGFDMEHPIAARLDEILSKEDPHYKENPEIKWNFTKFLIGRDGEVIRRFEPTADATVMRPVIEALL